MMRKEVSEGQRSKFKKYKKNDEKRRFRRSNIKKSEKKMRKDVSRGQRSKFKKSKKNDEKRRFRRSKVKVQKIRKNDEKRRFRRLRGQNSENPKK